MWLTWQAIGVLCAAIIVPSAHFSNDLISSCEDCNSDEGDEEGESRGDMPPAEDDAQIRSIPSEQHLSYLMDQYEVTLNGMKY